MFAGIKNQFKLNLSFLLVVALGLSIIPFSIFLSTIVTDRTFQPPIFGEAKAIEHFDAGHVYLENAHKNEMFRQSVRAEENYRLSAEQFTLTLSHTPNDPSSLINRGNIYIVLEEFELAHADFNQVLNNTPNSTDALLGLAHVYEKTGDTQSAIHTYETVLEIAENSELWQEIRQNRIKEIKSTLARLNTQLQN